MRKTIFIVTWLLIKSAFVFANPDDPIQYKFCPKNEKIKNFSAYLEAGETDYLLPLVEALPESSLLEGKLEKNCYLAWIYFYQGKYQLAAENWPSEYFQKMAEYAKQFKPAESRHFQIFTKDRDIILNDYALEAMEEVYDKIGLLFNYFPKDKIRVEIYSTSEEFNLASTLSKRDLEVSGAIGICKFNRIMLLSPETLAFGFRWQDALAHEYVHLLIQRLSRGNCPLWLHEGIAKYSELIWRGGEAGYLPPSHQNLLAEAVKNNSLITFQQMHPSLVKLNSQEEVSLAFAEVCWAIKFLVNKSGEKILPKLLINLSKYPNPQTAFKKTLALSMNKFEKQWRKNLAEVQWSIKPGAVLEKIRLKGSAGDEIEEFVEQSLGDYLRLGDRFRQRRAFSTAQEEYAKAEAIEPNNPVILNKLAKLLLDLGDPAKAEEKFKQAIQNNPNYGPVYTNYADLLFQQKRYREALTNYQESNRFNPFNPLIHKMMGIIYLQQNDQEKARQEWQIAQALLPQDRELSNWLIPPPP
ncbi:MAG: tetratricopeptide repeat protein [Elusimicrobiota bacterium]